MSYDAESSFFSKVECGSSFLSRKLVFSPSLDSGKTHLDSKPSWLEINNIALDRKYYGYNFFKQFSPNMICNITEFRFIFVYARCFVCLFFCLLLRLYRQFLSILINSIVPDPLWFCLLIWIRILILLVKSGKMWIRHHRMGAKYFFLRSDPVQSFFQSVGPGSLL